MLVTVKDLLSLAEVKKQAVGCFVVTGLETIQAVIGAAEKAGEPVIITFVQMFEETGVCDLDTLGPIMVMMAEKATVPVAVHLDHGVDLNILKKALDMGFTSVMYDGSALPLEENIANTRMAVYMAQEYGASVEAEIGMMSGLTLDGEKKISNRGIDRSMFTDPAEARYFVEQTGVDCLACAFGTVHGLYKTEPRLDFELIQELSETIGAPVVMHGGSGISEEDFGKAIDAGVRKINYYTYMALRGGRAVEALVAKGEENLHFHDVANTARAAMEADAANAIRIFRHK